MRKIFSHSIVGLLLTGVVAVATVQSTGCGSTVDKQPSASVHEPLGQIAAQPQTQAETGIHHWIITLEGQGVLLDGKTVDGVSVHQLRMTPFATRATQNGRSEVVKVMEIRSSGGGVIRYTSERRLLEYKDDPVAFGAWARDTDPLRKEVAYNDCTFLSALLCSSAIIAATGACGPVNWACIAAILGTATCWDCFCWSVEQTGGSCPDVPDCPPWGCDDPGGGGGTGGGPGDECYDCGDGRIVCPPQVCP